MERPTQAQATGGQVQSQFCCPAWLDEKGRKLRLDKFLYFARFAKSRAKSVALIQGGGMRIDGKPVMSTHVEVKVGQTIALMKHNRFRAIRVLGIPARRGPAAEAQACYEDLIAPEPIDVGYR